MRHPLLTVAGLAVSATLLTAYAVDASAAGDPRAISPDSGELR